MDVTDRDRSNLRAITREITRRRDLLTSCGINDADIQARVRVLDRIVATAGKGTVTVRVDARLDRIETRVADPVLCVVLDAIEGEARQTGPLAWTLTPTNP